MKAQRKILWLLPLLLGLNIQASAAAPTPEKLPLCDLQRTAKQGEQRSVQVGGIYITGFEGSVLTDAACPDQSTWVELDLKSAANKEQLRSILDTAGKADVVFEGEFYGPGMPSPNLPEGVRKSYQPGWGHLGAFKTKLVVHAIQSVKPVPADHPGSADLSGPLPILQGAALPVYPPIGRAASVAGKVVVEITVSGGQVTATEVKSGPRLLTGGTVANLQTWRFASDVNGKFTVTYTYVMSDEETDSPTNPTVEMLPSLDVKITAHPVKPIPMYSAQGVPAADTTMHEVGHVLAAVQP
jgi:hypothetical protein